MNGRLSPTELCTAAQGEGSQRELILYSRSSPRLHPFISDYFDSICFFFKWSWGFLNDNSKSFRCGSLFILVFAIFLACCGSFNSSVRSTRNLTAWLHNVNIWHPSNSSRQRWCGQIPKKRRKNLIFHSEMWECEISHPRLSPVVHGQGEFWGGCQGLHVIVETRLKSLPRTIRSVNWHYNNKSKVVTFAAPFHWSVFKVSCGYAQQQTKANTWAVGQPGRLFHLLCTVWITVPFGFSHALIHWIYWATVPRSYDVLLLTYVTSRLSPNSGHANQLLLFQPAGVNWTPPFIRYTALKVVSLVFLFFLRAVTSLGLWY